MSGINKSILAGFEDAPLESWYRRFYFNNTYDISGSGVEEYSFSEIKEITGFSFDELDEVKLKDVDTQGGIEVRHQLAEKFGTGNPEHVVVTNGANEALHLAIRSLVAAGDEIITLGPCYHCHDKIATSLGCIVKRWNLSIDNDFQLDFGELAGLLSSKTKALVLNFPHNPTGKSISQAELNAIVELAQAHDVYLVWDAVFQELTYDTSPLIDPIKTYSKAITIGTFSKAYGAPGLRFGWLIAPEEIVQGCIRQKDYGNLYVAPITEFVASKMLSKLADFANPRRQQALEGRNLVKNYFDSITTDFIWQQPDGGVCGLLKAPSALDDVNFCEGLVRKHGVLLVPGSCFGVPGSARLGFGGNPKDLSVGIELLGDYLLHH